MNFLKANMEIFLYLLLFALFTTILVKSADILVDSAEIIGLKLKLPYFFIGSILIGFGTSLPELATSISAVLKGFYEIPVSNVVGSNITNLLVIIGLSALIFSIKIKRNLIKSEIPFLILSSLLIFFFFLNKQITFFESLIFLISFFSYIAYVYKEGQKQNFKEKIRCKCFIEVLKFLVSLIFLSISSKYVIEYLVKLSELLLISIEALTAILLALGTSLPELVTSFTILIKRKEQDMIVGNVIGSNIMNAFLVLGLSSLIAKNKIIISDLLFDLSLFLILITFLFAFIIIEKRIEREEGLILLILYLFYLAYLLFPDLV